MRMINKIFAYLFGYFWLPCSICGRMFGGHESAKTLLTKDIYPGVYITASVCKNCNDKAIKRNKQLEAIMEQPFMRLRYKKLNP